MAGAPSGFIGRLASRRPFLTTTVLALGLTALSVTGVRKAGVAASADLITAFILSAVYGVGAPLILSAAAPRRLLNRMLLFILIVIVALVLGVAAHREIVLPGNVTPPHLVLTLTAMGLFAYLAALAPLTQTAVRLSGLAPFAAILGVAGGAGFLALETALPSSSAATAAAIALAIGVTIGAGIGADFSKHFARGATNQKAAAASGHAALAPTVFSIITAGAMFAVQTTNANFGAIDWSVLWGGVGALLLAAAIVLVAVTGSLSLAVFTEQLAVDENRRREWFAQAWRPLRRLLPATTALAAMAIAGVLVVIAMFEVGVSAPISLIMFLAIVGASAALVFVSLRTSLLIVAMLVVGTILADYVYAIVGAPAPALPEKLTALTLTAIALSQLTVSWRDAGDVWRNARDVAQNAMNDGLHRFLTAIGASTASLVVVAQSFGWPEGAAAAGYLVVIGAVCLILAPVIMVAMSAKLTRY